MAVWVEWRHAVAMGGMCPVTPSPLAYRGDGALCQCIAAQGDRPNAKLRNHYLKLFNLFILFISLILTSKLLENHLLKIISTIHLSTL